MQASLVRSSGSFFHAKKYNLQSNFSYYVYIDDFIDMIP